MKERREWSPAEIALLKRLTQDGLDAQAIQEEFKRNHLDRTYKSISRKIQKERAKNPFEWHAMVRFPSTERFDRNISLQTENILLLFDIHAPFHDARWINRAIGLAIKMGCDTVGIGGDLVDFSAFSKWGRQDRVEAEEEICSAEQVVTALAKTFKQVVYCGGNHENRLPRKTDNLLSLISAMELFVSSPNVEITDYHWFEVISGGERFYIEHPKNASSYAAAVPRDLCSKFLCHVIAGHGHNWGITRDKSGQFWAIDAGMCADPLRLAYNAKVHSRGNTMLQGAVILSGGMPLLLCPQNIAFYGG